MGVVTCVTFGTGKGCLLENLRYVTFLARNDRMLPDKRKTGQVVIEPDIFRPASLIVAPFAALSLPVLVDIIRLVTVVALCAELFLPDGSFVTGFAAQASVLSIQTEFRVAVMIEFDCFPPVGRMTRGTVGPVTAFVAVVVRMTRRTILSGLLLSDRDRMAGVTSDVAVAATEFKTRIPIMFEPDLLPLVGNMTIAAFSAKSTAVNIVEAMTVGALGGCLLIAFINVALLA